MIKFEQYDDHGPMVDEPPPPTVSARSGRHIRLPARYTDFLPAQFTGLRQAPYIPSSPSSPSHSPSPSTQHETEPDSMGLYRVYPTRPTLIPDADYSLPDLVDAPTLAQNLPPQSKHTGRFEPTTQITLDNLYSMFSNPTAGLLMLWQYSGSTMKSISELNRLAAYTGDPLFNPADALSFSHDRERKRISKYLQDESNPFRAEHGWMHTTLEVPLIKENVQYTSEDDLSIPLIDVKVVHRSITEIMESIFKDAIASTFHMTPFQQFWNVSEDRAVKVYSEVYSSSMMLEMHNEVNALPRDINDPYERVVVPLLVWSDATQLANFGDASLWPIYLSFGNQSKYTRGKPTSASCHHLAYIPKVSICI